MTEEQKRDRSEEQSADNPPKSGDKSLIQQVKPAEHAKKGTAQENETRSACYPIPPISIVNNFTPQSQRNGPKWTDIAIVILTAGIVYAAWLQTRIFVKQLMEMHDTGTDTHTLAQQAVSQVGAMNGQLTAMQNQITQMKVANGINREALESVQRAFISFTPTEARYEDTRLVAFRIWGNWENSGATPAIQVWARSHYAKVPKITSGYSYPFDNTDPIAPFVIGPHSRSMFESVAIPVSDSTSGFHSYYYGWAVYRDSFNGTGLHLTEFCQEIWGVPKSVNGTQMGEADLIETCPQHSCYDKHCPDYKARTKEAQEYEAKTFPPPN
jgi:hypothetical protein